ncbi:MAG: hypothetical protein L3K08_07850, partial [Thermoplasmata archaeon]|nr:hypothetical protein [Thermoplasmata archaeon]
FRSGVGLATVSDLNGNVSLVRLADGSPETLADGAPTNGTPVGGEFLAGSPSTILLWYRMPSGGEGILYDAGSNTALATIPLNGDVTDVEGICGASACSIAAANRTGIARWSVQGASVAPEAALAVKGLGSFGIVQSGGSELYYGLLSSNDTPDAVKSLYVGEVRSPLPPVTAGAPGSGATGPGSPSGNPVSFNVALYLGIPLIASAAVLVVIALRRRRPPGPSTSRNLSPPAASSPPSGELGPPSG